MLLSHADVSGFPRIYLIMPDVLTGIGVYSYDGSEEEIVAVPWASNVWIVRTCVSSSDGQAK